MENNVKSEHLKAQKSLNNKPNIGDISSAVTDKLVA